MEVIDIHNEFLGHINIARAFDDKNQLAIQGGSIDIETLNLLTEAIFFKLFRNFENFVRDIFLAYAQKKSTVDGSSVISYLEPKNWEHTEEMITSSSTYLDWNSPDTMIKRSDTYLENGFPVKDVYTTHRTILNTYRKIRNHYAHNSTQSLGKFKQVIRVHFGVLPSDIPSVGQYLNLTTRNDNTKYYLQTYFDNLELIADELKR